jgi:Flp pilus assembly protein TadG
MLSLLALAGLLCIATADAANVLVTRARVQTAADAAALAAATAQWRGSDEEPAEAARVVAEANGVALESCVCERHSMRAVVTVVAATRIRMLGVAPRHVTAQAEASVDVARLFRPASGPG